MSQVDNSANNMASRRLAVQLASQLPEDPADAMAALRLTQELVSTFFMGKAHGSNVKLIHSGPAA